MEVTKEQIKEIDHRLENDGVKYWDIRIEMLDHVVSEVENTLKKESTTDEFNEMVQAAFVALGWRENFKGGGFEAVYLRRLKNYSKSANRRILTEYKENASNFKTIVGIGILYFYLFTFRNNPQVIKYTLAFGLLIFVIFFIRFALKHKVFNSARLNKSVVFATFPISVLNCFMFFPKVFFGYEKLTSTYAAIVLGIIIPFFVIGINFLFKEFKAAQKFYNKLIDSHL